MCGIAGILAGRGAAGWSTERLANTLERMTTAIAHRGPDDSGGWVAADGAVALGHRRLSIVDLSERGHQPMRYRDRFTIVFNGEIYNFRQLRETLSACGHTFHSGTDTEIIMAAVEEWGLERALQALSGMFAFALWDAQGKVLHLARDRLGEKPLFLAAMDGYLLFASELRAIESVPGLPGRLSGAALAQYLRNGYVPAPWTPWEGVYKLPQATFLSIPVGADCVLSAEGLINLSAASAGLKPQRYWTLPATEDSVTIPTGDADIVATLEKLLDSSVELQRQCDVPMGAFLSGGIDSTTVVASLQAQSSAPVDTFTVKFDAPGFDESQHAAAIARHLGTRHHEIVMSPEAVLNSIPQVAANMDEPTANASYFPLYLMAKEARQSVKVILSGDGGDELFGGYNRYRLTPALWRRAAHIPKPLRRALGSAVRQTPGRWVDRLAALGKGAGLSKQTSPSLALKKLARVLDSATLEESYRRLMWCWEDPSEIAHVVAPADDLAFATSQHGFLANATRFDLGRYLPDDNLAKSDRATMAAALEARVPLLDHRIVEFANRLPDAARIRDGVTKWALREVAYRRVPRQLLERPKMGFTVPVKDWLRGPLFEWADDLLASPVLFDWGLCRRETVARQWHAFVQRGAPLAWEMWALTMYAAWLKSRTRQYGLSNPLR